MRRNPMLTTADRLGWFAYLTVMGGGVPYWPALFASPGVDDEPPDDAGVPVAPKNPYAGTVPYRLAPEGEREEITAA